MRLGIIAEIHANLPALEAALEAVRAQSVDQVLAIGDLVGYGPHPKQVLKKLDREGISCVPGAADERVAFSLPSEARQGVGDITIEWTRRQIGKPELSFLRSLRPRHKLKLSGGRFLAMHGLPDKPEFKVDLEAPLYELIDLLADLKVRWAVISGRHIPFHRSAGNGLVIDPGSVGLTLGGEPGADVLILDELADHTLQVRYIKVDYDFAQTIFDLAAWELPPVLADVIRQGRFPQ